MRMPQANFPSGLIELNFGDSFNQNLTGVVLPKGLQELSLGNNFNKSLDDVTLPESLRTLTFGDSFNQSLEKVKLPKCLQELSLGNNFNKKLDDVTLPESLRTLTFGDSFNQSLEKVKLPKCLQELSLGVNILHVPTSLSGPKEHQTCCVVDIQDIPVYVSGTITETESGNCFGISHYNTDFTFGLTFVETFGGHYNPEIFEVTCSSIAGFVLHYLLLNHIIFESIATHLFVELFGNCFCAEAMQQTSTSGTIPLTEYRREVPPGWGPNIADYPLRSYFEKLRLWYRVFDGEDEVVGPLVAGRLIGRAQKLAINLRLIRPDGGYDVGDQALVRLTVDEVRDPTDPNIILQHHIPSGVQALCNALRDAFGQSDQDLVSKSLEAFFEFRRGKLSLQEYAVEWDMRYDEAEMRSGLHLNDVAKFYLWFKHSALPHKFVEDIKLQLHGDLTRFNDARSLALRLSQRGQDGTGDIFYEDEENYNTADEYWSEEWYSPGSESYYEDESYDNDMGWYYQDDDWWPDEGYDQYYEDESWQYEEAPQEGQEQQQPAESSATEHTTDDYYKGNQKGKNVMGLGCHICGSKWHSSSSCPVNVPDYSKGKNYGKGKGNKGYGGFRPSFKGHGKKGKGFGYRPYGSWKGRKGKGYGGKSYGKKGKYYADYMEGNMPSRGLNISYVRKDFPTSTPSKISQPTYFRMDEDAILPPKPTRATTPNQSEDGEQQQAPKPQNKVLSFAMFLNGSRDNATYHTVKGEKRRGLLIDPGAASGLIGSETLRDIMENCIPQDQHGDCIKWNKKTTSVAGISGQSDETLGEVSIKLSAANRCISYKGDVLGGNGSLCPALVGNPTLRQQQAAMFSEWFPNGDGLLVIHREEMLGPDKEPILLRLLLTDSGHYLLPTDTNGATDLPHDTADKVAFLTKNILQKSEQLWPNETPNLKHCFHAQRRAETDRSETISIATAEQPAGKWPQSGSLDVRTCPSDRCYLKSIEPGCDHRPTGEQKQVSFASEPDEITFEDDSPHAQSDHQHPSGALSKPIERKSDTWTVCGQWLVREHHTPRRTLYTPHCARNCPVPMDKIMHKRKTEINYNSGGTSKVLEDNWKEPAVAHSDLGKSWTGRTWFLLQDDLEIYWDQKKRLDQWMPEYLGDQFPFSEPQKLKELSHEYRAMPEEFYTKTGRRPVTPENFERWFAEIKASHANPTWHFLELFSGSGRLSLSMATAGLSVGPPIDLRYGWNINDVNHQKKLWRMIDHFKPGVVFASPRCKFYSTASNTMDPEKKLQGRKEDEPSMIFLHKVFQHQSLQGRGFGLEQPWGSTMLHESELHPERIPGCRKKQRCDQCMLGACDEFQQPIQKATGITSNFKWRKTSKRCSGHHGKGHAQLQGKLGGINRTALAAVYPRTMCHAMCKDVIHYLHENKILQLDAWPKSLHYVWHSHLYKCVRCQLGRSCPPGIEHSLLPGECRHAVYPTADGKRPRKHPPEDPIKEWKKEAKKNPLNNVVLAFPHHWKLSAENRVYWKAALMQVVQESLAIFNEAVESKVDYHHWVTDQTLLAILRGLVSDQMYLKGIKVCLRPTKMASPEPQLSMHTAPLRIQIRGNVKVWTMDDLQDLTTCSHSQIEANTKIEDWQITLFGKPFAEEDKQSDPVIKSSPKTPTTTRSPSTPMPAPGTPLPSASRSDPHPHQQDTQHDLSPQHQDQQPYQQDIQPDSVRWQPDSLPSTPDQQRPQPNTQPDQVQQQPDSVPSQPAIEDQQQQADASAEGAVVPAYEDEEKFERREIVSRKPLYDFRKVFQRLPQLAVEKPAMAERLLLCLHEKFWHAPPGDFKNLLARAGMPLAVLELVGSAVMKCQICRRYVRLPNRPQLKLHNAGTFNQCVQADLFKLFGQWFMIMVDEATRYKVAVAVNSHEAQELQQKMLEHWMRYFGPPAALVMDQETSLMSHETGAEFERLNIERKPKGTTAGAAAAQHTGTGLVERHTGLLKLTMLKLKAEMDRQGISCEASDLAMECAMAHNSTLNYGGVTPAMAVLGILPRGFYDDESRGVLATAGALQTDLTVFERAVRIRQMSLAAVQQAIVDDRTARANRTRSHRLDTMSLVPGTSEIEFYREVQGDVGWRGPALLLRLDSDEGTAVIQYQGRPYLVAIRHIRPHVQTFLNQNASLRLTDEAEDSLFDIMKFAEMTPPFLKRILGYMPEHKVDGIHWRSIPLGDNFDHNLFQKLQNVAASLTMRKMSGMVYGRSLKFFKPPKNTTGHLITWCIGSMKYGIQEHWSDDHVKMKKISAEKSEDVCVIYIFYHVMNQEEDTKKEMKRSQPERHQEQVPPPSSVGDMSVDDVNVNDQDDQRGIKRDGPESRTVVIAPEKKKVRLDHWASHSTYFEASSLHYMMDRRRINKSDLPDSWTGTQLWAENEVAEYVFNKDIETTSAQPNTAYLFHIGARYDSILHVDLRTSDVWRVDTEHDDISEEDAYAIWPQVEEADRLELQQFVQEGAFKKRHCDAFDEDAVIIDARWVRKWKKQADGGKKVKSRLCARGCLDSQKDLLTTRSTTATRLSQRLLLSTAAVFDFSVESWDIAGAFLKGLNFKQIQKLLRDRGINSPSRTVILLPPANVWRHLAAMSPEFAVKDYTQWGLICIKPVYGLNDAPLAWQLCLQEYLKEIDGVCSVMDENSWRWKTATGTLQAVCTCHVDDMAIAAPQKWLDVHYDLFVKKFKKVSRQQLPFEHCGARYERTPDGFRMVQSDFCERVKPATIASGRKDEDKLNSEEVTSYRSILGALLWLTATRLDLIADVSYLASHITVAEIKHLRQANQVLVKAQNKDYKDLGLYFRKLNPERGLRLACFHDSSSHTKDKAYAHEGVIIMLMEDRVAPRHEEYDVECSDDMAEKHGGTAHILWSHGAKAKRISYSTSHAETLAAISGHEAAVLVSVRISEMLHKVKSPTLQQLAAIQETGNPQLPLDDYGDCNDVFQLVTQCKTLPQDKSQRIYILSLRESRLSGRIRWMILIPTRSMAADALTKPMLSKQMMMLLSTGILHVENEEKHHLQLKRLPAKYEIIEHDLETDDQTLIKQYEREKETKNNMWWTPMFAAFRLGKISFAMLFVLSSLPMARAEDLRSSSDDYFMVFVMVFVTFAVLMIERMVYKFLSMWNSTPRTSLTFGSISSARTSTSAMANAAAQTDQPDHSGRDLVAHEATIRDLKRQLQDKDRECEKAKQEITKLKMSSERSVQRLMETNQNLQGEIDLLRGRALSGTNKRVLLSLGNNFNKSLDGVTLPKSLRTLTFGVSFNQSLDAVDLPNSLQNLSFGRNFSKCLDGVAFPGSLRLLTFGDGFSQSLDDVNLPQNLQSLTLGNQFTRNQTLQASLQDLTFGSAFNQSLRGVVLPASLKQLTFGNMFNQRLDDAALPRGLQSLTFGCGFNQSLDGTSLPPALQNLIFGDGFNQSLDGTTLPESLQRLTFGDHFNQSLDRVTLPAALQELTFGNNFNQT
eukprot:s555_g2.t1